MRTLAVTYDGLLALGLTPHAAGTRNAGTSPQPYLCWTHPGHPGGSVDWLSQAVRLSSALSGVLDQLEAADDTGTISHPGSGVAQPGGGWLSGP